MRSLSPALWWVLRKSKARLSLAVTFGHCCGGQPVSEAGLAQEQPWEWAAQPLDSALSCDRAPSNPPGFLSLWLSRCHPGRPKETRPRNESLGLLGRDPVCLSISLPLPVPQCLLASQCLPFPPCSTLLESRAAPAVPVSSPHPRPCTGTAPGSDSQVVLPEGACPALSWEAKGGLEPSGTA